MPGSSSGSSDVTKTTNEETAGTPATKNPLGGGSDAQTAGRGAEPGQAGSNVNDDAQRSLQMAIGGAEDGPRGGGRGGKQEFLVGVVEGFYGRPWTTEQRKDLFSKMQVSP